MSIAELLEKSKHLPSESGCYLMKSASGKVIYVGKAKNLRSRVSSYFQAGVKNAKTQVLVSHIRDLEFIITENEVEALVLENNLIKEYSPKYNIRLKDDRSYPYVLVDMNEDFPRLQFVRRPKRGEGRFVFGPFVTGSNLTEVLRTLNRVFKLRDCKKIKFSKNNKPCLLYQMGQCSAPCAGMISSEDYGKNLKAALRFFEGAYDDVVCDLQKTMHTYAENEEYEKAAFLRDQISVLESFIQQAWQKNAEFDNDANVDVAAFFVGDIEIDLSIYMVRSGVLLGQKHFYFPKEDDEDIEDSLTGFLLQYYTSTFDELPSSIVLEKKSSVLMSALNVALKGKVKTPLRVTSTNETYKGLWELALKQAKQMQWIRLSEEGSAIAAMEKLKDLLQLKERPRVLECFDIAIWQGDSPAASQVVWRDGVMDKESYRHYHMMKRPEGNNDFAMMEELISRRIRHGDLPDVFVVDGGTSQVNVVVKVLEESDVDVPVVGIAKARGEGEEERLVIPGRSNPFILSKHKGLLRAMVMMRDEAHRFSRRLHHKEESKRFFNS